MKKKLSLNKLKITAMDANALRGVRGGDDWLTWDTYEPGCTVPTMNWGCTDNFNCTDGPSCETRYVEPGTCDPSTEGMCSDNNCATHPDVCMGETQHVNCPTNGPECGTRTNPCTEYCNMPTAIYC